MSDKDDCISRQMALDAFGLSEKTRKYGGDNSGYDTRMLYEIQGTLESLPAVQPDHNADISEINKFIDGLEEIFADIRERHVDDSVCGLCEYDGAYMGQSGDWCNECPGFDKDDCFKLSDETRKKWIEEIVNTYPDHTADIGKKVSISCGQENDLIFRQAAIDALARMMPRSYTPDGSHPADEEIFRVQEVFADCIEALEILPSAAPSTAHTTETTAETTAPSTDDWIPCSERLPENDDEVLITIWDAEDDYVEVYKGFYQGHEWWTQWCHGCSKIKDEPCGENIVIAWMPLPKPYRGGEQDE